MMMPFFSKTAEQNSAEPATCTPKRRLAEHNRQNVNYSKTAGILRNQKGDISIYTCFFIVGAVMLVSFLLLYASIRITCINISGSCLLRSSHCCTCPCHRPPPPVPCRSAPAGRTAAPGASRCLPPATATNVLPVRQWAMSAFSSPSVT
ncbi:MAG TPA: hypothetical protein DCZ91_23745 [Lachnospiraceae bacterium]|nr:hypothetical protein [Lachnospiraceae bacterium]